MLRLGCGLQEWLKRLSFKWRERVVRTHHTQSDTRRLPKTRGIGLLLVVLVTLEVASAFAQTVTTETAQAAAAMPQGQPTPATQGVEEIVVTAQKREQFSQQVPIALTVLTAANIQFRGIDDLSDLAMQVPGMQYAEDLA